MSEKDLLKDNIIYDILINKTLRDDYDWNIL